MTFCDPALSVVANCRICLVEVWAPNPRAEGALEAIPKLLPACQTPAGDGQVVYTDSPKAIANQKAVMEYLLINHPVDCPVCDQAGECHLQDYSYQYGRGQSRFQEQKLKQPKKDIGPHVLLYADRCIMCTRCVRFTREITGTNELLVQGRGSHEEIDVFPGLALDNELSGNVVDICPVGALLDKHFLFRQRVWDLKKTPSIDGLTASGDNISIEHNDGRIHRVKPRTNPDVNGHWITDEVRYGWTFVHDENRLAVPSVRGEDAFAPEEAPLAYESAYLAADDALSGAKKTVFIVSPMLSCEDAYLLGICGAGYGAEVVYAVGPVPVDGVDKTFPAGFRVYAEKAPNARGVRRVLEKFAARVVEYESLLGILRSDAAIDAVVVTGNYPSRWVTEEFLIALDAPGPSGRRFVVAMDTLPNALTTRADVVLPAATWTEKSGSFENAGGRLQVFDRAIAPLDYCKSEAQIALDLVARRGGAPPEVYDAAVVRQRMASSHDLGAFASLVPGPAAREPIEADMQFVEL